MSYYSPDLLLKFSTSALQWKLSEHALSRMIFFIEFIIMAAITPCMGRLDPQSDE